MAVWCRHTLETVGLAGFENKQEDIPAQRRRAAARRHCADNPTPCDIVLADEPTGSLDQSNRAVILDMIKALNADGKTVIIVTHDQYVAACCTRQIKL